MVTNCHICIGYSLTPRRRKVKRSVPVAICGFHTYIESMNVIDRNFYALAEEISRYGERELYYRIRIAYDLLQKGTRKSLADFFNKFGYWGRLDPANRVFEEIELKAQALHEHIDDFAWVYERLQDYRSKKTLYAVLSNWFRYDFVTSAEAKENMFDDYFDLDLVKCSPGEVIADLGAYTGDTVRSYIRNYGENCYKRIYCYEITESVFAKLKENLRGYRDIEFRLKGVGDSEGVMYLSESAGGSSANSLTREGGAPIPVTTLDDDVTEPLTLIKADIEGYEQKALAGAEKHIANDHPKLLLSVYHNNEDLWKIPKMIDSVSDDYKFYLRYKSSPLYPTEITLIAL